MPISSSTRRRIKGSVVALPPLLGALYFMPAPIICLLAIMGAIEAQTTATWRWAPDGPGQVQANIPDFRDLMWTLFHLPLTLASAAAAAALTLSSRYPQALIPVTTCLVVAGLVGCWLPAWKPLLPSAASALWIGAGMASLLAIRLRPDGFTTMSIMLALSFSSDIGGYAVGKSLGSSRHETRLQVFAGSWLTQLTHQRTNWRQPFPHLSPGKTWWGTIAWISTPLVIGITGTLGLWATNNPGWAQQVLILAICTCVATPLGDLGESWFKRRFKIKDTSSAGFGHGGWLDRLDAIITTAAASWLALTLL